MMLRAIAVYQQIENKEENKSQCNFRKTASTQKESGMTFFSKDNELTQLETTTLPNFAETGVVGKPGYKNFENGAEHHYLKKTIRGDILAMVSKTRLRDSECFYLFHNIEHVIYRSNIKTTLNDILKNPVAFLSKDILTNKIDESIQETIKIAQDNINAILDRGEKIETLVHKSEHLEVSAVAFQKQTKKLNSCCRSW